MKREYNEDGSPVPFTKMDNYNKLRALMHKRHGDSNPFCNTKAGKITEWTSQWEQPTYDEIDAVTDEELEEFEAMEAASVLTLESLLARIEALEENVLRPGK